MIKIFLLFISLAIINCAKAPISYSPSASYDENDFREINDEDILKAFEASPQIKTPTKIAWYNLSNDSLMDLLLEENEKISGNYVIPKTLIEGFRPHTPRRSYYYEATPINFKAIRLLAARAKCDLVALLATSFDEERSLNAYAWFNILIIPSSFTPYLDVKYLYNTELFLFDVRNGYMYKTYSNELEKEKNKLTQWNVEKWAKKINDEFVRKSAELLKKEINQTLSN